MNISNELLPTFDFSGKFCLRSRHHAGSMLLWILYSHRCSFLSTPIFCPLSSPIFRSNQSTYDNIFPSFLNYSRCLSIVCKPRMKEQKHKYRTKNYSHLWFGVLWIHKWAALIYEHKLPKIWSICIHILVQRHLQAYAASTAFTIPFMQWWNILSM